MPHHHVETIAASPPLTGAPWISALLAPDTITYYFFRGGIDGYPPVYHSQHVRPPGITRLSREIHERLVPDLLEHLFRTQGHRNVEIIMPDKCDNATCECQVCGEFRGQRLNRSRLRMLWALLASSEASPPLPNDFTPEYETGFSLAFGIPSNLPSVPWATSYYCNLISKQNNRELLTEEETEAFVAWLEVQRPVMAATALEQIEMGGGALQVDADWIRNEEFLCPPRRITNWAVRKLVVEGVVPLIWAKTTGLVELDWDGRELGAWSEGNHELIRMRHQPAGVGEVIFGGHLAGEMWRDKARCCGLWPTMTAEDASIHLVETALLYSFPRQWDVCANNAAVGPDAE